MKHLSQRGMLGDQDSQLALDTTDSVLETAETPDTIGEDETAPTKGLAGFPTGVPPRGYFKPGVTH